MRILWLDDEPERVSTFSEALEASGHQVEVVANLEFFEERVEAGGIDAVVIDLMLPSGKYGNAQTNAGLDTGLLVARRLLEEDPEVQVVVLTNRSDVSVLAEEEKFEVLSKINVSPWDLPRLLERRGEDGRPSNKANSDRQ